MLFPVRFLLVEAPLKLLFQYIVKLNYFISFNVHSNPFPLRWIINLGNKKKSSRSWWVEYEVCCTCTILYFTKNFKLKVSRIGIVFSRWQSRWLNITTSLKTLNIQYWYFLIIPYICVCVCVCVCGWVSVKLILYSVIFLTLSISCL